MLYRTAVVLLTGGFVLMAASSALAHPHPNSGSREEMRKKIMEKYDANKDGKLDEKERTAARKAWSDRRGSASDRGGPGHRGGPGAHRGGPHREFANHGGPGKGGCPHCRKAAGGGEGRGPGACRGGPRHGHGGPSSEARRKEFMKKFDKNSNGKIDEDERKAIRAAFAEGRGSGHGAHRGGPGRRGGPDAYRGPGKGGCPHCPHCRKAAGRSGGGEGRGYHGRGHGDRDGDKKDSARGHHHGHHGSNHWADMKKEFMEKYDKNSDGKLSDDEKKAVRESWAAKHKEWREKMRKHHHGSSDSAKKDTPKKDTDKKPAGDRRDAIFKRIMAADKNGDGKLNADEMPVPVRGGFSTADLNKDGYIDAAELRKRLSK